MHGLLDPIYGGEEGGRPIRLLTLVKLTLSRHWCGLSEPGREKVVTTFPGALLSTVNLSEIIAKLTVRGANLNNSSAALAERQLSS